MLGHIETPLAVAAAMLLTLALSATQSLLGARVGTDHPVHVFLTRAIRGNGYRLFERIPRLLNVCYCGAVPLYIHWTVAHFRAAAIFWAERLLNPCVNTAHVALFALLAYVAGRQLGAPSIFVALATCAFALTPQFYHALSARNFGMSARGTGLLLLTAFFFAAYNVEQAPAYLPWWLLLAVLGWLIWGTSTFGQQALCFLSVILLLTGRYAALLGAALGLSIFIAIHPRYSLSYLRHTLRFIRTYATELAPLYILRTRPSIWRDLVRDIWLRLGQDVQQGVRYAYENSFLVVILLNPMIVLASWGTIAGRAADASLLGYGGALTLAGVALVVLTSFRPTRFLGEPERYAEAVTPWGVLVGAHIVFTGGGPGVLAAVVVAFLAIDLLQLFASSMLLSRVQKNTHDLEQIEPAVRSRVAGQVRFCSNNEQFTKLLMQHDWHYAYCLAVGQEYCGMSVPEAFSTFPFLRREACERIVTTYRVNACLLDRQQYETLFDERPADLVSMTVAFESPRLRLLILDWQRADGATAAA